MCPNVVSRVDGGGGGETSPVLARHQAALPRPPALYCPLPALYCHQRQMARRLPRCGGAPRIWRESCPGATPASPSTGPPGYLGGGLEFGIWALEFRVQALGLGFWGEGSSLGSGVWGVGFRVQGLRFEVCGLRC